MGLILRSLVNQFSGNMTFGHFAEGEKHFRENVKMLSLATFLDKNNIDKFSEMDKIEILCFLEKRKTKK